MLLLLLIHHKQILPILFNNIIKFLNNFSQFISLLTLFYIVLGIVFYDFTNSTYHCVAFLNIKCYTTIVFIQITKSINLHISNSPLYSGIIIILLSNHIQIKLFRSLLPIHLLNLLLLTLLIYLSQFIAILITSF